MTIRGLTLIFLSLIAQLATAQNQPDFNQTFQQTFHQELKKHNIPGGTYVILDNNKITALETYGYVDLAKSQRVTASTVFRLASVSKTFAGTLATMLAQENKIDLNAPVTRFVPQFALANKGAADKIQLKHVLSHSSGLLPNAYDNLLNENWHLDKIISQFKKLKPLCPPAQCYGYQNIAYSFIEPAIEQQIEISFADLLTQRIFEPLKMRDASIGYTAFQQARYTAQPHILHKRIATGHKNKKGQKTYNYLWKGVKVKPSYYKVAPAAGVNASILDLAKWLAANLGHNPEVISPAVINETAIPRIQTKKDMRRRLWRKHLKNASYGYGWRIYQLADYKVVYHSGWVQGFRADIGYSPELGIGFAMLVNAETNAVNKLSRDFWTQAHQLKTKQNTRL
ncbi:serine hydrolase [Saccharobesus litoralis]|uniref:Serine hydrolase n=1 Tax=Saccharobesus litoralis TaxID=2172099 RepID=A0A2S0VSI0_9ALTE|nr:serine hydrolase domain-containing protein [Saccharobesus litoralis]AWB67157.1 serine hydrolase [Saccharobesus litoralis]